MTKKCSCCLHKSQGEMTRIGRPMKNMFKDLIQDFELPDGKMCKPCHENLVTFSSFKARITRLHNKQGKKTLEKVPAVEPDFQRITIKCEPLEVAPATEMFASFDVHSSGFAIKTEIDNQNVEIEPLVKQEPESIKTPNIETHVDSKYESDSNGADDDWNRDDFPFAEQEAAPLEKPVKKGRPKKYKKHKTNTTPKMPRCKGQNYECDLCGLKIKHKTKLKPHFVLDHQMLKKDTIPCKFCTRTFYKKIFLIKHIHRAHADQNEFHCNHCYSIFSSMELLREHRRIVHLKAQMGSKKQWYMENKKSAFEKVLCPHCGTIITKTCLKAHISKVHLKEKKFGCTDCGKRFQTKPYLRSHIAYHHSGGAKPFQCDLCPRRYPTKHGIFKHIQFVHDNKQKTFKNKCELCWKLFYAKQHLTRHMKRMHVPGEADDGFRANPETNMFHCADCPDKFLGKLLIIRHISKHHR